PDPATRSPEGVAGRTTTAVLKRSCLVAVRKGDRAKGSTMCNTHDLTTTVPGGLLLPGDPAYIEATSTLAGEGRPDLVVRPRTSVDAAAALRLARQDGLPRTVRAGGHSMAGLSTPPEGLLLDLRPLDDTVVEPGTRLVRVGGGARWGSVARALQPHG